MTQSGQDRPFHKAPKSPRVVPRYPCPFRISALFWGVTMPHTTRISLCIRVLSFLVMPGTLLLGIDPTPAFAQCGGMRGGGGNAGRDFGVGTGIGLGLGITREIIESQRSNQTERATKQGKATKKDTKADKKTDTKTRQGKSEQPSTEAPSENVWTNPTVWMNPATGEKVYREAGKEGPKGPPGTSWILVNPPKEKTVYLNPATGKTIEVKKGEPAPKVPAGTTWVVLKWSPPREAATGESKTPPGQTVPGELAGGGGCKNSAADAGKTVSGNNQQIHARP